VTIKTGEPMPDAFLPTTGTPELRSFIWLFLDEVGIVRLTHWLARKLG
jgi:hypothetical protein